MKSPVSEIRTFSAALVALVVASGCVDEKIVFVDRDLVGDLPTGAASFLGYSDHDTKLTVCGNCHVEKQAGWEETHHASAWSDLQDSGHASATCEGCHSVGKNGNYTDTIVGYEATGDQRYEDVQCEACHGPGLTHVSSPTNVNVPLAPMSVGVDLTTGCGECHSDVHNPFVEEWATSRHANQGFQATRDGCRDCHSGDGALEAWGDYVNYAELADGTSFPITCATCHDPHGGPNEHQLRFPIDQPSVETNLCMKCHQRRANPDPTSSHGPHSPQGPLLLGTAGWWPSTLEFTGPIYGTHGSEANPGLCTTCHLKTTDVTNPETGSFVFHSTGHLFRPIPCLDSLGIPQPAAVTCDDSERDFSACASSGCHGTQQVARNVKFSAEQRIEDLVTEAEALIAMVPAAEFNTSDNKYTVGEGASFNAELASGAGAAVHNKFLVEALLVASIRELKSTYGLGPVNPALSLEVEPAPFSSNH